MIYGVVVTETFYKDGKPDGKIERARESVRIDNNQQMLDHIFKQLDLLKQTDQIDFSIFTNKHSHEPCRMEITVITKH